MVSVCTRYIIDSTCAATGLQSIIIFMLLSARLRVDEENLMLEVTMETKLDYLIPTTSGHGICTTALVDYLVQIHNAFIERCRAVAQEKQKRF